MAFRRKKGEDDRQQNAPVRRYGQRVVRMRINYSIVEGSLLD